jgi:hypothetical protein
MIPNPCQLFGKGFFLIFDEIVKEMLNTAITVFCNGIKSIFVPVYNWLVKRSPFSPFGDLLFFEDLFWSIYWKIRRLIGYRQSTFVQYKQRNPDTLNLLIIHHEKKD